jgi:hypothetical protein
METSVLSRHERDSLPDAIKHARLRTQQGDGQLAREDVAKRIWNELYHVVPALNYSYRERARRELPIAIGNPDMGLYLTKYALPIARGHPDPCKDLVHVLTANGLPDSLPTSRLVTPAFWTLRELGILTEHARQDADSYLYQRNAPLMHFQNPEAETAWYRNNITIIELPLLHHTCTLTCNPDGKECILPRPWITRMSPEAEQRCKLSGADRPDISNYLWMFDRRAWESQGQAYQKAFDAHTPYLVANLEAALKQKL